MHIRIFFILLGVLISSCVQKDGNVLYVEKDLPVNIEVVFESELSGNYIELINVKFNVVTQYPYIRMARKDHTKTFRLSGFPNTGWQALHLKNGVIFALLDFEIEGPGSSFHVIKISNNGGIQYVGDIKKNYYFESHIKSYIKGDKLVVITENDTCEKMQKTTYEFNLTNHLTRTRNKTRAC